MTVDLELAYSTHFVFTAMANILVSRLLINLNKVGHQDVALGTESFTLGHGTLTTDNSDPSVMFATFQTEDGFVLGAYTENGNGGMPKHRCEYETASARTGV